MNKYNRKWLGFLTVVVLVLSGCAVHKEMEPVTPGPEVPENFTSEGTIASPDRWWLAFEDPELNTIIETALSDNLTIRQAWKRLDQMRAVIRISGSGRWPQVNVDGSTQRQRSGEDSINLSTFQPAKTIDTFSASATVSYQVDLWKKIDASIQADILGFEASRKDLESTAITIVSSAADLWISIAEQQAVLALLNEQLKINQEFLELVELRFSQGSASAVDVYQQRLQLSNTRNQIPPAETALQLLKHQLAVLLGRSPGGSDFKELIKLPQLPPIPDPGIPLEVLRKRPDVRAAELRIYASDRRVAVAIADRFPTLSFSSSAGARSNSVSDFFDRWFVNLAGNLLGPIFDGGRRAAEVDRNMAVLEERMIGWKQTMLNALREVEDALVNEQGQNRTLDGIKEQIDLANKTLERARSRYINGLSSYLDVLTSLQALQNLQRGEVQVQRQLLSNRIKLYIALGGNWIEDLENPSLVKNSETEGEE